MKIIFGLGNYGNKYSKTRHNIGFETIDKFAYDNNIKVDKKKHKGLVGEGNIHGEKVVLVKPQTYMNLSGECVKAVTDFYKVDIKDMIVIYDDISLDLGKIRVRGTGSAGGQNGMKNIINIMRTKDIQRIRVGIGEKPPKMDLSTYVLSRFLKEEENDFLQGVTHATEALEDFLQTDFEKVMTKHNSK